MVGAGVRVCAGVDQHRRSVRRGNDDRDPRPQATRQPTDVEERRRERCSRVPRGDDRLCVAVADGLHGAHEGRARLRADGLGGLLLHADHLVADDELETARIEPRGPVEDGHDPVGGRGDRALDDLVRAVVAAECVDRDADRHARV